MEKEEKYLGKLLQKTLSNNPREIEILNGIDKEKVLDDAMRCGVLSLVYPYLCINDVDYNSRAFREQAKLVARNIRQKIAFEELIEETEKENIDILMLKGIWINSLYPVPENRTMRDIDLFYFWKQKKKLFSVLKRLNYKLVDDNSHHSVWFNSLTSVSIEMHHTLERNSFYDNPVFEEILSRIEKCENKNHLYHMTLDDSYIYQMIHIHENVSEDTGSLKQLCDLCVLKKNGVNFINLHSSLRTLGILDFAKSVENVILYLFDDKEIELSDEEKRILDIYLHKNTKAMTQRIVEARIRNEGSKNKFIVKMFFPKKEIMYISYPVLKKHKYLLPFFYIRRMFSKVINNNAVAINELKRK